MLFLLLDCRMMCSAAFCFVVHLLDLPCLCKPSVHVGLQDKLLRSLWLQGTGGDRWQPPVVSNTNEVLIRPEPIQEDQTPVETDLPLPDVKVEQIEATAQEESRPSERCAPEIQLLPQLLARAFIVDHCALTSVCNTVTSHAQLRILAG